MHLTAEEVEARLVARLGESFGRDLYNLKNAYVGLRTEWRYYRSLFGTNEERVDLLNSCSGVFFSTIERVLFDSVLIGLCRITDPVETGRGKGARRNMTFVRLRDHIIDDCRKAEFDALISRAEAAAAFARDWRNRRIAHSDYEISTGASILAPASRDRVQLLMDYIGDILQWVYIKFLDSEICLDALIPFDDEVRVLTLLYKGVESEEREEREFKKAVDVGNYRAAHKMSNLPQWLTERS